MKPWILFSILLASLACQLVGLVMFAKGFFPYKAISTTFSSMEDLPPLPSLTNRASDLAEDQPEEQEIQRTTVNPRFGKVVLMLVDALRSDFLYGNESDFTFMQSLIDTHRAVPFTALASAPTVTLPRLKALTTGTVPGFLDAILNIAESDQSSTLAHQDNWIAQLARSPSQRSNARKNREKGSDGQEQGEQRKIAFFGDDTWIKLFPGLFFRSEGTSSFFAMDTVEVDNNVTRHVEPELAKDDWDGLIFHYLGLDHVGHSGGPKSALMRPKQAEMDSVAETIYKAIITKDQQQPRELPTLFILCGDHGMNEVGNHGGSSRSEISTSFLFMSSQFEQAQARSSIQAMVDPYRQRVLQEQQQEEYQYYRSVNQVDLVPTLSLLMGLPIPKNSIGKLIPELFSDLSEAEKLRALQINAYQVAVVLKSMWSDFEVESLELLKDYKDSGLDQEDIARSDDNADENDGIEACGQERTQKQRLACWFTLALAGHASFLEMSAYSGTGMNVIYQPQDRMSKFQSTDKAYSKFLEESSSMLSTALSNYDMSLLTNGSLMMAFAVAGFIYCALQTSLLDDFKASCLGPQVQVTNNDNDSDPTKFNRHQKHDRNEINWSMARALSVVILILYLITLFASSFVEEEHQFWYFFTMTWWAVLGFTSARYLAVGDVTANKSQEVECVHKMKSRTPRFSGVTMATLYCLLQMAILRLLRSWNQTGQKYADQIDLRHYLNSTWIGLSWALFWATLTIVAGSMIYLVYSMHPFFSPQPFQKQQQLPLKPATIKDLPIWRSATIRALQAGLFHLIVQVSLWIVVYKMDLESAYFGDETMERVHAVMSKLSSVGYSFLEGEDILGTEPAALIMSGYELARGCYAVLALIVVLGSVIKVLLTFPSSLSSPSLSSSSSSASTSSQPSTHEGSQQNEDEMRLKTLFEPYLLLGTVTLLLILLSRRHNAPLFVLFGIQLYMYLSWTTLIRQRDSIVPEETLDQGTNARSAVIIEYLDQYEDEATTPSQFSPTTVSRHQISLSPILPHSWPFRTLPGQNSIHSCTLLFCTLSSFFLFGNSNSIASIDISNAYVGIQAYDIGLTGVLTFVSNWAGPIWWTLAAVVVMRWDLELEMLWARQNKTLEIKKQEERAWKSAGGWKRNDKGTMTRKTKRRIKIYKQAVAKSQEAAKKQQAVQEQKNAVEVMEVNHEVTSAASMESVEPRAQLPSKDTSTENHQEGQPLHEKLEEGEEGEEGEEDGSSYVYEEQQEEPLSSSSLTTDDTLCVLTSPLQFKRHLVQTRMLDHLILTSTFFGITLYALCIAAIVLRHHLFIWTVFSPKVLYQFAWTVLFQIVIQVLIVGCGIWTVACVL
ncbi:major facilitator super transporter protein [Mortierella claussenii]|nr:major facilitator super transporter protein [Mortierella claussenii]